MKLSTADCQNYLVQKHAEDVKARYEEYSGSPENQEVIKNALNPKKWKRMTKYNVGSDIDRGEKECAMGGYGGMEYHRYPKFVGGVVRTFYLEGTDHITYNLIEVDGKIVGEDDCGD